MTDALRIFVGCPDFKHPFTLFKQLFTFIKQSFTLPVMTISAKQSIITAAKCLFGEKGFDGASVREISKRAKVNIAMIHYYFGCKEKLYNSILTDFAQEMMSQNSSILTEPKDATDLRLKLTKLVTTMCDSFDEKAPLIRILMRETMSDKKNMSKAMTSLTTEFFFIIRDFFQQGINKKIITAKIPAEQMALVFLGALSHPIEAEVPLKKTLGTNMNDKKFRDEYCTNLISVLLDGVLK